MIYAKVGESFQQIGGSCPDGFIVMQTERPGVDYVAKDDGTWGPVEPQETVVTPEVDQNIADLWQAMLAMSTELETLKGGK